MKNTNIHICSLGFIGKLLGPLIKVDFPLTKNTFTLLAKNIPFSIALTAAADVGIQKIFLGSRTTTLN